MLLEVVWWAALRKVLVEVSMMLAVNRWDTEAHSARRDKRRGTCTGRETGQLDQKTESTIRH
jgi:hypothetical protein